MQRKKLGDVGMTECVTDLIVLHQCTGRHVGGYKTGMKDEGDGTGKLG